MRKIILASKSKRRSLILKSCGIPHIVFPSKIREIRGGARRPSSLVILNAKRKAEAVAKKAKMAIIIGVDTLVLFEGRMVGKPLTKGMAKKMLEAFSGKKMAVYSGVHIIDLAGRRKKSGFEKTVLSVKKIPRDDIERYFRHLGPCDKAGGFSIEGAGSMIFDDIKGSYFNVLGLPMRKLQDMFRAIGLDLLDFISG